MILWATCYLPIMTTKSADRDSVHFTFLQKYYNILLGEWAAKYEKCPRKGNLVHVHTHTHTLCLTIVVVVNNSY